MGDCAQIPRENSAFGIVQIPRDLAEAATKKEVDCSEIIK